MDWEGTRVFFTFSAALLSCRVDAVLSEHQLRGVSSCVTPHVKMTSKKQNKKPQPNKKQPCKYESTARKNITKGRQKK